MQDEGNITDFSLSRDQEGFLLDPTTWSPEIAQQISAEENIELSEQHWEVINFLREFYQEYQMSPSMRALINGLREKHSTPEIINSIYLHKLFPQGPAIQANKIAGLPKPVRCI